MLEKLITQIKQSLPEALRKKLGIDANHPEDDEDDDGSHENSSPEYRYEGFEEDELEGMEDEDEEDSKPSKSALKKKGKKKLDNKLSDEDEKKKRNSMLIKVVAILGIGYLAIDMFVLSKNEEAQTQAPIEIVETEGPGSTPTPPPAAPEETVVTQESTAETPTESSEPTVENINILEGGEAEVSDTSSVPNSSPTAETIEEASSSIDESATEEINVDESIANSTPVETSPSPSETSTTPDFSPDQGQGSYTDLAGTNNSSDYGNDLINTKEEIKIENKIIDTPTDTPAPSYEQFGRGLVYNCVDKHWACIDKPAYVQCNKNHVWNKQQGKAIECVVKAVYNDEKDCVKIQMHYVSTNESTAFCN